MTNMELYNGIENPLDQENFVNDMLKAYNDYDDINEGLRKFYQKDDKMYYNPQEAAKLYSTIYNKWKKMMTTRTRAEWNKLIAEGKVEEDIFELVDYLAKQPDETSEDARFRGRWSEDEKIRKLLGKYGCFSYSWNSGEYIESIRTSGFKDEKQPTEHRLYLNVPGIYQHEFMFEFIKECEKKGLPYYIKYYEDEVRDDSVIIYSSTKFLTAYVELLQDMEKTHQDLISKIKRPPIITGKINNWIGYGSEPIGKFDSYNGIRADIIEEALDYLVKDWFRSNKDKKVEYNGQQLSFSEYAIEKEIDDAVERAKKDPEFNPDKKYFYFDGRDIMKDEKSGTRSIRQELRQKIQEKDIFENWLANKNSRGIEFIKDGIEHHVDARYFCGIWKEYVINNVINGKPKAEEIIKKAIVYYLKANGIDPNKICFDVKNVALMEEEDKRIAAEQEKARSKETTSTYKPMTEEEIRASREKLGINVSQGQNTNQQGQPYRIKFNKGKPIADERKTSTIKTKQGYVLEPMTDEQIKASREKIAKTAPVYQKK